MVGHNGKGIVNITQSHHFALLAAVPHMLPAIVEEHDGKAVAGHDSKRDDEAVGDQRAAAWLDNRRLPLRAVRVADACLVMAYIVIADCLP